MNEKTITNIALTLGLITLLVAILLLLILTEMRHDPLDVNRDGKANLVDLSVLAAKLNERNSQ